MNVVFRSDSSRNIGIGHFARNLALAIALRDRGAECVFVTRAHNGNASSMIKQQGFRLEMLPKPKLTKVSGNGGQASQLYHSWLGVPWEIDAAETIANLPNKKIDWLVVDHYALDAKWENELKNYAKKILVIDDLANRKHECDILLDQNLGRSRQDYRGLCNSDCEIVTGPTNALLRQEFADFRDPSLSRRASASNDRLLINMGGVDKNNATGRILDSLSCSGLPGTWNIVVVMGQQSPWKESISAKTANLPWAIDILVNVNNMAEIMASCDVAIGAGGTAMLERCCLGLPTLIQVIAENQRNGAEALCDIGGALAFDSYESVEGQLNQRLSFLRNPDKRRKISDICATVTDGKGTDRIAEMMLAIH